MNSHAVSCLILAGGKSQRMNHADKGLVEFKGRPLIEHVINALRHQVDDFVISANRNLELYKHYSPDVVPDVSGKHGPLSGIASALPTCSHDRVLVVPCDMPFLPDNLVDSLLTNSDNSPLSIIKVHTRMQLVFLMHKSLLGSVQEHLDSDKHKLMQWVEACSPVIIDCSHSARAFRNINSIHDLDQ
ncbi:MAG: molybdenum cofactor guanylyltransferase [Gammaproteobacteria bacterium]|nr:molybdenum cofactor guanylyltransferase [Gammaproteobacteria bacterium]